ncbi:MAG: isocitrate lyase/PEP mutase family protein [Frankia sp.]
MSTDELADAPAGPPTDRFRARHHDPDGPLVLPNAWDAGSAASLVAAGFDAIGTTSLGVAAAAGYPDGEGFGRAETIALAGRLARLPCLVTVDLEAGLCDRPDEVAALVAELAASGVVGVNLEDGRPGGLLAEPERHRDLIVAVKERNPAVFLNARVDTYWLAARDQPSPAATVRRAEIYVAAGADGIFVPGVRTDAEIATLASTVGVPLNVLYQPGGQSVARLAELGVRRVSTGSLLFRAALGTIVDTALAVRDGGPVAGGLPSYTDVQRLAPPVDGQEAGLVSR